MRCNLRDGWDIVVLLRSGDNDWRISHDIPRAVLKGGGTQQRLRGVRSPLAVPIYSSTYQHTHTHFNILDIPAQRT